MIEAHVYSTLLKNFKFKILNSKNIFPAISLVVSGGHTDLVLVKSLTDYKKIGQTLDDAAGEAFDKIAKLLGLPYPGGAALAELAKRGKANIDFPRPLINSRDFNFSFSGLKTAVLYFLKDKSNSPYTPSLQKRGKGEVQKANIAASAQKAIIEILVEKTMRAAKKYKARTILLSGGVAANKLLRKRLKVKCQMLSIKFLAAKPKICTDNAAMIAFAGYLRTLKKKRSRRPVIANANWEI